MFALTQSQLEPHMFWQIFHPYPGTCMLCRLLFQPSTSSLDTTNQPIIKPLIRWIRCFSTGLELKPTHTVCPLDQNWRTIHLSVVSLKHMGVSAKKSWGQACLTTVVQISIRRGPGITDVTYTVLRSFFNCITDVTDCSVNYGFKLFTPFFLINVPATCWF